MADELVIALLKDSDVRVLIALTTELSRHARKIHHAQPASASILAQGLTGGVLLAALQKQQSRINLQLECDGPLRGFFVDADPMGGVRGYVKNALLEMELGGGAFRWRPVLGNKGFLSVLRDRGSGEFYRSSVELTSFDISRDLEHYFRASDQIETGLQAEVVATPADQMAAVGGVLLQCLPSGNKEELHQLRQRLIDQGDFARALAAAPDSTASALLTQLVGRPDLEVMSRYPLTFQCTCSIDRVKNALLSMGKAELEDILAKEGEARTRCEFCTTQYVVDSEQIRELIAASAD